MNHFFGTYTVGLSNKQVLDEIDNLGGGHCGFYSFIIGGLHLAKNYQKNDFISRWKELDPSIAAVLDEAQEKDLKELSQDSRLMNPLMKSLRQILSQSYLNSLPSSQPEKNLKFMLHSLSYSEFLHLCRWADAKISKKYDPTGEFSVHSMSCNFLWQNLEIRKIAMQVIRCFKANQLPDSQLEHFIYAAMMTYQEEISKAYQNSAKLNIWMSESQAFILSDIFKIPVVIDPRNTVHPMQVFVHLNNKSNIHWTTLLYNENYSYPFNQIPLENQFASLKDNYFSPALQAVFLARENRKNLIQDLRKYNPQISFREYIALFKQLKATESNFSDFSGHLQNNEFFILFRNCIDAKEQNENEYQIECLRLLIHLDKDNAASYQERLNICLQKSHSISPEEEKLLQQHLFLLNTNKMNARSDQEKQNSCTQQVEEKPLQQHSGSDNHRAKINFPEFDSSDEDSDEDDFDDENLNQFLENISQEFTYLGTGVGFLLSTLSGIVLLTLSVKILPVLLLIAGSTILGCLIGMLFDLGISYVSAGYSPSV